METIVCTHNCTTISHEVEGFNQAQWTLQSLKRQARGCFTWEPICTYRSTIKAANYGEQFIVRLVAIDVSVWTGTPSGVLAYITTHERVPEHELQCVSRQKGLCVVNAVKGELDSGDGARAIIGTSKWLQETEVERGSVRQGIRWVGERQRCVLLRRRCVLPGRTNRGTHYCQGSY